TRLLTRAGPLWSVPYPQELNDIPAIVARQMTGHDFADMVVDHFDEMREQSRAQPLVMGLALHPYLVGQPHRLRPLRRALRHLAAAQGVWWTTPGRICDVVDALPADMANAAGGAMP
ncbi:MAG: polysaccharide deacetylase, partial [Caldimonas sp.]